MKSVPLDKCEIDVVECTCGYHMGFDSSYLLQVDEIRIKCPSCGRTIDSRFISDGGEGDNPFMRGEDVILKGDGRTYTIYAVYSATMVSLCIHGYKDSEADYLTNINALKKVKK